MGEPGIGKTALIEGLAQKILSHESASWIRKKRVLTLDIAGLVAGTRYRGDFEERFKLVLKEIDSDPNTIIFIDEIHMIMGAGSGEGGNIDIANMLKPMLARSGMQLIGATTLSEYKLHMEKDKALTRRFQVFTLREPSEEEALNILKNLIPSYENFHGLTYTEDALKHTIRLSQAHMPTRKLPDKAIDLLDITSAQKKMTKTSLPSSLVVTEADIKKTLQAILQTSPYLENHNLSSMGQRFNSLHKNLNSQIKGHESLIKEIVGKLSHSTLFGMEKEHGPFLSCLLVGETATGKTFLAKTLSGILWQEEEHRYLSFDLNDFSEASSLSRLVGMPLGFTGYKEGGELTEALKNFPNTLIIFENVDKAHPLVLQTLLKILKEGFLQDNKGQRVSFSYALIFFTITLSSSLNLSPFGFSSIKEKESSRTSLKESLSRYLTREFMDYLDVMGLMKTLKEDENKRLINTRIEKRTEDLKEKGIELSLEEDISLHLSHVWQEQKNQFKNLDFFLYETFERSLTDIILKNTLKPHLKIKGEIVHNLVKFAIIR